jgi:hypothetical protein
VGNDSNNSEEWDDEFFLGYFSLHAETELALFHRKHVERLLKLAGKDVPPRMREWLSVHSETADPLIAEARKRLAEAEAERAVDYVHDL